MEAPYIKAIETRLRWLRWARSANAMAYWQGLEFSRILPMYEKVLEQGETYFMNSRFCQLTDFARQDIPDDLVWESSWMQSRSGWMWLAEPFNVPHIVGWDKMQSNAERLNIEIKIPAIGWYTVPTGYQTIDKERSMASRVAKENATHFLCFQDFNQINPDKVGFGAWSYFMLQDGDVLIDRIHSFEESAKESSEPQGAYPNVRKSDMLHEIRWIYAAFHLMAQKLAASVMHQTDRATKRRELREKEPLPVPSYIKVVTLRRLEEDRKKETNGDPKSVDWSWQWTVQGHWRKQWYPSLNCHKQIFIEAYIKGPDDKPLKPPQHQIFVARR